LENERHALLVYMVHSTYTEGQEYTHNSTQCDSSLKKEVEIFHT